MKKILEILFSVFRLLSKPQSDTIKKETLNVPTLNLELNRIFFTKTSTIGELKIDGKFECYTLEDEDRLRHGRPKVYGITAIPTGIYEVDITWSPKYKRDMPTLLNVEGFSGIRIHSGNWAIDSEGCILVGRTKGEDYIGQSKLAYRALFKKLQAAKKAGKKILIRIE